MTTKFKTTKQNFQKMIVEKFSKGALSAERYSESVYNMKTSQPELQNMTLYYKNGKHIATWSNGNGWFIA